MWDLLAAQTDWVQVTKDLGFPIAVALGLFVTFLSLLSMCAFALWRIGVWTAPILQRMAEAHIATMQTFQESSERQDEHRERTTVAMEQHAVALESLTETTKAIQREITEQRKLNEKVCDKMSDSSSTPLVAIQAGKVEMPENRK